MTPNNTYLRADRERVAQALYAGTPGALLGRGRMIGAVLCEVGSTTEALKVTRPVIELVPIDVVDDEPGRHELSVGTLPHEHGSHPPDVRLGDLHSHPMPVPAVDTQPLGADREMVDGPSPGLELGLPRAPCSLRSRFKIATLDGRHTGTAIRAAVDCSQLGTLPIEGHSTDRADEILAKTACGLVTHTPYSTGSGATHAPA